MASRPRTAHAAPAPPAARPRPTRPPGRGGGPPAGSGRGRDAGAGAGGPSGGRPRRRSAEEPAIRFVAGGIRPGLAGHTRAGAWTPLRVTLENPTDADAELDLAWTLPDAAGDRVAMRRRVVVPAGREADAWLYGVPPAGPPPEEGWPVTATEPGGAVVAAGAALVSRDLQLGGGEELLLVMSAGDLGLGDYARHAASHADRRLVRGLNLSTLPDRVQGLSAASAIVWAADGGGDPAAAGVPATAIAAWGPPRRAPRGGAARGGGDLDAVPSRAAAAAAAGGAGGAGATPRRAAVSLPTLGMTRPAGADAAEAWVLPEGGGVVLLRAGGGEPLVTTAAAASAP